MGGQSRGDVTYLASVVVGKALQVTTAVKFSLVFMSISGKVNLRAADVSVEVAFQILC